MRRYTFYLSVALLAFGIGSLVVFKFYFQAFEADLPQVLLQNETNVVEDNDAHIIVKESEKQDSDKKLVFVCEYDLMKPVWSEMLKSESFKDYVKVRGNFRIDKIDCAEEFDAKLIDVNDDGIEEIAVQGKWAGKFCGMYSGCNFWLFKKSKNDYQTILKYGDAFDYKLGGRKHLGFRDVILKENGGNYGFRQYFYRYNGMKYKAKQCLFTTYDYYDKKGRLQESKTPITSKDECPKDE